MAKSLSSLRSSRSTKPPIAIFYGVHGIGKSSLAAEAPSPIYLPTPGERPPSDVDIPSFGDVENFGDVLDAIGELLTQPHDFKNLIVDSLDGLEPLVWAATAARLGVGSIEEPGYGKGYVEADSEWRDYLGGIDALRNAGIGVIQLAHSDITRFDSPTTDPYSRYGIKLHKRASGLVQESADLVGFMNYRITLKEKEVGPKKSVAHGEGGGDRNVHFEERPGFLAKNRYSMPSTIPFKKGSGWSSIAKFFPEATGTKAEAA